MNSKFFILLFLLPLSLFCQKKKYLSFDENWNIPISSEYTIYSCECNVDDAGKFFGKFTCYHDEKGVLVKEYHFKNDVLDGTVKDFYLDGSPKLEAVYDNGLPILEWKEYDEEGRLVKHQTFDESSRLTRDYFQETTPYDNAMSFSNKKEEPPIYTTACMRLKIEDQKFACSEKAIQDYIANPPIPPTYKEDPSFAGSSIECLLQFRINEKGIVDEVKIIKSTGDSFLDDLAGAHVLNMIPFESAKQYGNPIKYWQDAQIVFQF